MLKEALDFTQDSDANNGELGDDNGIDEPSKQKLFQPYASNLFNVSNV
jgi:hypothetical protein